MSEDIRKMIDKVKNFKDFINENEDKKYKVRIKPNINNKAKWYYGYINKDRDLTGKELIVKDGKNPNFPNTFDTWLGQSTGGQFIDKDDCEILEII